MAQRAREKTRRFTVSSCHLSFADPVDLPQHRAATRVRARAPRRRAKKSVQHEAGLAPARVAMRVVERTKEHTYLFPPNTSMPTILSMRAAWQRSTASSGYGTRTVDAS